MHGTVIPSLAILKVNWDAGWDYIENFVPFVAESVRTAAQAEVSLPELQRAISDQFGFTIPQGALSTIVRRAAKRGYLQRRGGIYLRNDEAVAKVELAKVRNGVLRRYEALIRKLTDFCKERFGVEWSAEEADAALLAYLEEGSVAVLAAAVEGKVIAPPKQSVAHAEFLVGSFVAQMCEGDPSGFDFLETIVKGSMLAGVLLFPDLRQVERRFDRVQVYFDTGFVLQALGFEGESRVAPRRELLDLLYEQNARLRVFEHTLDEIRRVLDSAALALRDRALLRRTRSQVVQHLIDSKYSASDVELVITRLENSLRALRIELKPKPRHAERLGLDEVKLESILQEEVGYFRERALYHDSDSVTAIHRLRGGERQCQIESCQAMFVTTNQLLVRASARFFREELGDYADGMAPACVLDDVLTTLVWLKRPLRAPDLPRKRIVADCYAAMNPPAGLWRRYLDEIDRLETRGDISEDDYHLLRFTLAARNALMDRTFGAAEAFAEGTVAEVLEAAQAAARAETEAALRAEVAARAVDQEKAAEAERKAAEAGARVEAERQARSDHRRALAVSISRWVTRVVWPLGLLFVVGATFLTLFFPDLPGGLYLPAAVAVLLPFGLLVAANLVFGVTLSSATRQVEVRVSRVVERILTRLTEP